MPLPQLLVTIGGERSGLAAPRAGRRNQVLGNLCTAAAHVAEAAAANSRYTADKLRTVAGQDPSSAAVIEALAANADVSAVAMSALAQAVHAAARMALED